MPITLGPRSPNLGKLGVHVLFVQLLDCLPVKLEFLGNILDRRASTTPSNVKSKSFGIERVVRQEIQTLALHLAQCRQLIRRTSNSRKMRIPPQARSRAERTLRSYQPDCTCPHVLQAVFLIAEQE